MKKFGLVLAALAVIGLAAAPAFVAPAQAADKKLWEGWVESLKDARAQVKARMEAKMNSMKK